MWPDCLAESPPFDFAGTCRRSDSHVLVRLGAWCLQCSFAPGLAHPDFKRDTWRRQGERSRRIQGILHAECTLTFDFTITSPLYIITGSSCAIEQSCHAAMRHTEGCPRHCPPRKRPLDAGSRPPSRSACSIAAVQQLTQGRAKTITNSPLAHSNVPHPLRKINSLRDDQLSSSVTMCPSPRKEASQSVATDHQPPFRAGASARATNPRGHPRCATATQQRQTPPPQPGPSSWPARGVGVGPKRRPIPPMF